MLAFHCFTLFTWFIGIICACNSRSFWLIICHYHTFTVPRTVVIAFPADGVMLNFLGVGELAFPNHTLSFCLRMKVMDPCLFYVTILWRKICGCACKRQRRSVQTSTRFCFCSSINILGTLHADTFFVPKASDTIRYTVLAWMYVVSEICRIVRRLSSFNISLTIWTFSLLAVFLGRSEQCSPSTLFLPRLNSYPAFHYAVCRGIVAQCSKHVTMNRFARHSLRNRYLISAHFSNLSILILFSTIANIIH